MPKKIALLRGINVGGKRKILMADLKIIFEKMGFTDIKTYLQSGNVIFNSTQKYDKLEITKSIEKELENSFGFSVAVIVKTPEELKAAVVNNPFYQKNLEVISHLYLTFLKEEPAEENKKSLEIYNQQKDSFVLDRENIFIHCTGKYHESQLTNNFFEKKLKVVATSRNWKTVLQLYELSK